MMLVYNFFCCCWSLLAFDIRLILVSQKSCEYMVCIWVIQANISMCNSPANLIPSYNVI